MTIILHYYVVLEHIVLHDIVFMLKHVTQLNLVYLSWVELT